MSSTAAAAASGGPVAAGRFASKLRDTFVAAITACKQQGTAVDLADLFPGLYEANKELFDSTLSNMLDLIAQFSEVRVTLARAEIGCGKQPNGNPVPHWLPSDAG